MLLATGQAVAEEGGDGGTSVLVQRDMVTTLFDSVVFDDPDLSIAGEVVFQVEIFDVTAPDGSMGTNRSSSVIDADFILSEVGAPDVVFDGVESGSVGNANFFSNAAGQGFGSPIFEIRPENNPFAFLSDPEPGDRLDIAFIVRGTLLTRYVLCNDTFDGSCDGGASSITPLAGVESGFLTVDAVKSEFFDPAPPAVPLPAAAWLMVAAIVALGAAGRKIRNP